MTVDHVSQVTNGGSSAGRAASKVRKVETIKKNKHTQVPCLGSREENEIDLN